MSPLDESGLSPRAREVLPSAVADRVTEAWKAGRALILNANRPSYSEAFTIEAEQYRLVRAAIFEAVHTFADATGEVKLQTVVTYVQAQLETHERFPKGRLTNYTRYTKVDLEARGEIQRVPKSSPQRIRLSGSGERAS